MKIGICGAGQFSSSFATLWKLHPDVTEVSATDLVSERAQELVQRLDLDRSFDSYAQMLESDVDAVAILTQRWTHYELVMQAFAAGKHVYSAVPMGISVAECSDIVQQAKQTGLIYMMGETSYYNPAVVWTRNRLQDDFFGRIFYAEGDYVHDMDNGFYSAYQFSGGADWKSTASYPPMLYPTHAVGGVLGALPAYATSVSCIGVLDDRDDGVFDAEVSLWGNEFSNMSALFQLSDGAVMRTNEFRRVGHATGRESRFRFYGTKAVMEEGTHTAHYTTAKPEGGKYVDITDLFTTSTKQWQARQPNADTAQTAASQTDATRQVAGLDPALLDSFESGSALVHDRTRLPPEYEGAPNGHEGSHHFLADDFVRAVKTGKLPPVNAWVAARFTVPGIVANESARAGGARLQIPDFGPAPK